MTFFFQAEDGIRDHCVTGVQTLLFRSREFLRRMALAGVGFSAFSAGLLGNSRPYRGGLVGNGALAQGLPETRSEERRVGKECSLLCRPLQRYYRTLSQVTTSV